MRIFILKTDLFSKETVLSEAIAKLEAEHEVDQFDAGQPELEDKDWDTALKNLIRADRVLTI